MSLLKNLKAINQVKGVTRDDPHQPSIPGNAQCLLLEQPEADSFPVHEEDARMGYKHQETGVSTHQELKSK